MKKAWKRSLAALCVLALMVGFAPALATPAKAAAAHTIWLVGDSTVCNYKSTDDTTYKRVRAGYGMALDKFLDTTQYAVNNLAISGTSSKNFTSQSNYTTLFGSSGIQSGDVLIIGFGHNDQKREAARFTDPNGTYQADAGTYPSFAKSLFDNYIQKARAKGADVIVCTPIVRLSTSDNYTGSSGHITSAGTDSDGNSYPGGDYPKAIRDMVAVLADDHVKLVDLTDLTKAKYTAEGNAVAEKYHAYSATELDKTHLNGYGAQVVAQILAEQMKGLGLDVSAAMDDTKFTPDPTAAVSGSAYVEKDPSTDTYTPPTKGSTKWSVYEVGNATFQPTIFGSKAKAANTTLGKDGNGDMHIKVTGSGGSIGSTTDSIAMYYYQVPVGSQIELSATATLNGALGLGDKNANQCCFGLMARDDMYIEDATDHTSSYVVAGTRGAGEKTDTNTQVTTAFASVNCFYRKDGTLNQGPELTTPLAVGQSYDLKIVSNGDEDGFACTFGDEPTQTGGYDFNINSVDTQYYYVGMFASRDADVTFSNIKLVVDGVTICAPADENGDRLAITVQPGDHGTGMATPASAVENAKVTLTATPDEGYIHSGWEVVSPSGLSVNGNSFTMPAQAVTVKPTFVADPDAVPAPAGYVAELTVNPGVAESATNFHTVRRAVACATKMTRTADQRVTITITPGTYREQVIINTPNLTLKNADPTQEVKLTWYYGIGYLYYSAKNGFYDAGAALIKAGKDGVNKWGSATYIQAGASGFLAENIVFENSFNYYLTDEEVADGVIALGDKAYYTDTDITYDRTASSADVQSKTATERGAALVIEAENCEFFQCKFLGSQDTLYTSGTGYFKDCHIEGQTDYIFGSGEVIFDHCDLVWKGYSSGANGGHITAQRPEGRAKGYLFRDCTIKKGSLPIATGDLGRPWRADADVLFLNTTFAASNLISAAGWGSMSGVNPAGAKFREYGSHYSDGSAVDTSSRADKANTVLTAEPEINPFDYFGEWEPVHYEFGTKVVSVMVQDPDGMKAYRGNVGAEKTIQLSAMVKPAAAEQGVTWTSTSTTVTVSNTGLVTIPANAEPETVTITAASNEAGSDVKDTYVITLLAKGVPLSKPKVHLVDGNAELIAKYPDAEVTTAAGSSGAFVFANGSGVTGSSSVGYTIEGVKLGQCAKLTTIGREVTINVPDTGKLTLYINNEPKNADTPAVADKIAISNGIGEIDIPAELGQVFEFDVAQGVYVITPVNVSEGGSAEGLPFLYAIMWEPTAGGDEPDDPTPPDCEHAETEVRGAKEATCTEAGYTGDTYCKECNKLIQKGTAIAKIPHTYGEDGLCTVCGAKKSTGSSSRPSADRTPSSDPVKPDPGTTEPSTTTPAADDVKVEKTETATKADGTKVTTTQLSNGSTAVTEVTLDGAVSVDVTNKDGEKIVAIDVPAEIPVSETKFEDVTEEHWAAEAIDRMAALGMVRGVSEGIYNTDGEVTRATLATMLFRFSNGAEGKETTFADVPSGEWYADAIGWANAAGVVTGYSETTFGPNDQLTREQMAVMLLRFAKLIGMDSSVDADAVASFADADSVNSWAADGMAWCVKNGIINGTGDNTLAPGGSATRAQTAVMLDRFIGLLK